MCHNKQKKYQNIGTYIFYTSTVYAHNKICIHTCMVSASSALGSRPIAGWIVVVDQCVCVMGIGLLKFSKFILQISPWLLAKQKSHGIFIFHDVRLLRHVKSSAINWHELRLYQTIKGLSNRSHAHLYVYSLQDNGWIMRRRIDYTAELNSGARLRALHNHGGAVVDKRPHDRHVF
jgi:hypothetical protein